MEGARCPTRVPCVFAVECRMLGDSETGAVRVKLRRGRPCPACHRHYPWPQCVLVVRYQVDLVVKLCWLHGCTGCGGKELTASLLLLRLEPAPSWFVLWMDPLDRHLACSSTSTLHHRGWDHW